MKKFLGIILTFILLFGMGSVSRAEGSADQDTVLSKIKTAWDDYAEYVTFDAGQVTIDEFKEIYHEALLNNPEYYFVSRSVGYESINGYVTKATINYEFEDKYDYWNHRLGYNLSIDTCKRYIESDWTDVQKLQYINKYVCMVCNYDDSLVAKHTKDSYGALVNKCAVCEGYSMAFMALCKSVGIECYLVTSDSMGHAWNMVKVNDNYYMIDSTWNDTTNDRYKYFMKSISWFNSKLGEHEANDYVIHGGSIPDTYEFDNTYDNFEWKDCWDDEIQLNRKKVVIYKGDSIFKNGNRILLWLLNVSAEKNEITWQSSNPEIVKVDAGGVVTALNYGRAIITATYDGKSYTSQVEVRNIKSYFWYEYSGNPESSRWVLDNVDHLEVGQTTRCKFEELIYDEKGEIESVKDITDQVELDQHTGCHVFSINGNTVTALEAGANSENSMSELFGYIENEYIDFNQYIYINIFTENKNYQRENTVVVNDPDARCFLLKSVDCPGDYTLDGQYMQPADRTFYKYKIGDITWKVSDGSVISLGEKTGCTPDHTYSKINYMVMKSGTVTVSVYYGKNLISRTEFSFEKSDVTPGPEDKEDKKDTSEDKEDKQNSSEGGEDRKDSSEDKGEPRKNEQSEYFDKKTSYSDEWVNGKWYNSDGSQTYKATLSWKQDANGWWVEDSDGWYPKNQWQKIDGKWYYFCADGYMDYSEYRDGCWLGSDGAWVEEYYGGTWNLNSTGWWYSDSSGWYPANEWLWIDGVNYYFNVNGYCTNP